MQRGVDRGDWGHPRAPGYGAAGIACVLEVCSKFPLHSAGRWGLRSKGPPQGFAPRMVWADIGEDLGGYWRGYGDLMVMI